MKKSVDKSKLAATISNEGKKEDKGKLLLGEKIKSKFEKKTESFIPKKTYTIIRIDGKNFSKYTQNRTKPFDLNLVADMTFAAKELCKEIPGTFLAYLQSDEISIISSDLENKNSQAWFGGKVQKMATVSASIVTSAFNQSRISKLWLDTEQYQELGLESILDFATFDARVFSVPTKSVVEDYLVWRQQDCIKNSISMAAQSVYSYEDLYKKNSQIKKDMLIKAGKPWESHPWEVRTGVVIYRVEEEKDIVFTKDSGEVVTVPNFKKKLWAHEAAPIFTEHRNFLREITPARRSK